MRGKEIDAAALLLAKDVGAARDACGQRAKAAIAPPKPPHIVAEGIVPFQPVGRKAPQLIASGANIPRLGNHHAVGQPRIGGDLGKDRRVRRKGRPARQHRCQIEAEPVHPRMAHEMAQRGQRQVPHLGHRKIQRIAATGIVNQAAIGRMGIGIIVQPAQAQHRALHIALARMVEHQIEQDPDPRRMQRRHALAHFRHPARTHQRVQRHHADRIIAPEIAQPQRRQVPLVDPRHDGHQFHRADMQFLEMGDDRRMRQRRHRAADRGRNVGMQQGEAAHIDLVDQAAAPKHRRRQRHLWQGRRHQRARHDVRGIRPIGPQARIPLKTPIQSHRIGIDQQFGRIKPTPPLRRPFALRAIAIGRAGMIPRQRRAPYLAFAPHR